MSEAKNISIKHLAVIVTVSDGNTYQVALDAEQTQMIQDYLSSAVCRNNIQLWHEKIDTIRISDREL